MLALALIVWYVLEHTPPGRHIYAVGGNREAARLMGVRTGLVAFCSLAVVGLGRRSGRRPRQLTGRRR